MRRLFLHLLLELQHSSVGHRFMALQGGATPSSSYLNHRYCSVVFGILEDRFIHGNHRVHRVTYEGLLDEDRLRRLRVTAVGGGPRSRLPRDGGSNRRERLAVRAGRYCCGRAATLCDNAFSWRKLVR